MKHDRKTRARKPYRGSKAVDASCRSNGSCPACIKARQFKQVKQADGYVSTAKAMEAHIEEMTA